MRLKVEATGEDEKALRELGDAVWAAQKNSGLEPKVCDALKMLSTSIHAEAARLGKLR